MLGVDYSWARPGGAALKSKGYGFACRYLSFEPGKNISAAEVSDLQNNGIAIVLVWETTANRALAGRSAGQSDAQNAIQQANSLGFPANRPIYFAVDFDATETQQAAIDQYMLGAADIIGLNRVGVYGGYYIVKRCLDNGTAKWAWQTLAWSGGQQEPRNHIYQNGGTDFNGDCDIDESKQDDFGQWGNGGENVDVERAYLMGAMYEETGSGVSDAVWADYQVWKAANTNPDAGPWTYVQQKYRAPLIDGLNTQVTTLTKKVADLTAENIAQGTKIAGLEKQIADMPAPGTNPNANNPIYKFLKAIGIFS